MAYRRPDDLFDRAAEWEQLAGFVEQDALGLRVGVVSGRRRQGKSFLLRRLTRAAEGLYHQAQEIERPQALARFAGDVAEQLGLPRDQLRFGDWEEAFRTALGYPQRGAKDVRRSAPSGPSRFLVIDELPYLLTHSPEIPSVLQELHDEARDSGYPPAVVIVCGSALSVMSDLLTGTKPLRGRAQLDMTVQPFDYRTAAAYWGVQANPRAAFALHTVFGGTAGYKPLVNTPVPTREQDLPAWLGANVLNPAHALFHEKDYLLREDTRISDKQLYNSILSAVANGRHSTKDIGGPLERDANQLRYPLQMLVDAGFLVRVDDVLTARRPLYFLADPIVRFTEVVIDPYRPQLEEQDAAAVWEQAGPAYSSQIVGPHFEHLARVWTTRYSGDRWGEPVGVVGPAVINDPSGKTRHELDVVALAKGHKAGSGKAKVVVLGEAKATNKERSQTDLHRLHRIRDLLVSRGLDAGAARLTLFSREGFTHALTETAAGRDDVHLVTLEDLYAE